MNIKWREQAARWAEWLIVLLLAGSALYEIWISPGTAWPASPVVSTILAATIIVPVLFRKRFPLGGSVYVWRKRLPALFRFRAGPLCGSSTQ